MRMLKGVNVARVVQGSPLVLTTTAATPHLGGEPGNADDDSAELGPRQSGNHQPVGGCRGRGARRWGTADDSQVGLALVGIGAAFLLAAVVLPTVIAGRIYSPHTTA
jgi:hypothetical protein